MRLLILVLMIALLPLRALAGDVMATQMAGSAAAIEKGAARAHEIGAISTFDYQKQLVQLVEAHKAMPDCHEQAASHHDAGDIAPSVSTEVNDHCSTCAACQACHTVALSPNAPGAIALFASPQLRQTSSAVFTSADAVLVQKPPIS